MASDKKRKYFRRKVGMVFRVPLGEDLYGYGQIANETEEIFFDYVDNAKNVNIGNLLNHKVIFKIVVQNGPLHDGIWEVLGLYPVVEQNATRKDRFNYDFMKERYVIVKEDMTEVPSTPEEIRKLGLECFAAWHYTNVEDRLRDHFAGRKNYWIESFLNSHNPDFPDIETFYRNQGYNYVWEGDNNED